MRALVYHGSGLKSWDEMPGPQLRDDLDAVIGIEAVTICGTDLHILRGDVPEVAPGRVLASSTPDLLTLVQSGQLDPSPMVTHTFAIDDMMEAYDVFERAGETGALKVVLTRAAS